jgi:hypothetical protein
MKRVHFHESHDIKNKLPIIIHTDKMSVQKRQFFLKQNLELFLEPFALESIKAEGHLILYLHQWQYYQHKN